MKKYISLIISFVNAIAMTAFIAASNKDVVATHFNINMEADSYGSKWSYVWLAFIPIVLSVIQIFREEAANNHKNDKDNKKYETKSVKLIIVFFIVVTWVFALIALAGFSSKSILPVVMILMGLLLIYISNLLGKLKQNAFFGIKTYATLSSETVWKRTHRLGGYLGVVGGFVLCICAVISMFVTSIATLLLCIGFGTMIVLVVLIPMIYAQIIYKKEKKYNE